MIGRPEEGSILAAFDALSYDAPEVELSEFAATALGLNPSQRAALLPDQTAQQNDPRRVTLDRIAALLIARRSRRLADEGIIPSAVVFKRTDTVTRQSSYFASGLATYLMQSGGDPEVLGRVRRSHEARQYLAAIGEGLKLELVAASIMSELHDQCNPTRRGSDQGVDCLAFDGILQLDSWCCSGEVLASLNRLGERLHIIASCKANEGNVAGGVPSTISPAQIRELIGGWLIQRSAEGLWQSVAGIKLLSPIQLLLVTTYRLSDESLSLCRKLGVAVWGLPELTHLVCRFAPAAVFPPASGYAFVAAEADNWVNTMDPLRLGAPSHAGAAP
jgi:hypothetical protein